MQFLVVIGAILSLGCALPYIIGTIKGTIRPNKVTWFLWAIAPMISFFAALSEGVTWAGIPVFMSGFVTFAIFLVSFVNKEAYWKVERFDWFCGAFSLVILIVWYLTKSPNWAILLSIASDTFAAIPTGRKVWQHPETENIAPYLSGIISPLLGLTAVTKISFSALAFPLYLILMDGIFVILIIYRRHIYKKISKLN